MAKNNDVIVQSITIKCPEDDFTRTFHMDGTLPPEQVFCPYCNKMKNIMYVKNDQAINSHISSENIIDKNGRNIRNKKGS